jgi:hypothetical protein
MVRRNPAPRPDDPAQSKDFIKKAREIGADEEKSASDELMGLLHRRPPARRNPTGKTKTPR